MISLICTYSSMMQLGCRWPDQAQSCESVYSLQETDMLMSRSRIANSRMCTWNVHGRICAMIENSKLVHNQERRIQGPPCVFRFTCRVCHVLLYVTQARLTNVHPNSFQVIVCKHTALLVLAASILSSNLDKVPDLVSFELWLLANSGAVLSRMPSLILSISIHLKAEGSAKR